MIRGLNAGDVTLVDGMGTEAIFNRYNTQLNKVESVEILKGPSSVLYGGEAVVGGNLNAENLLNRERYFLGSDYSNQVYPGAPINVFSSIRFRFQP